MSHSVLEHTSTREYRVEAHRSARFAPEASGVNGLWSMSMPEGSRLTGTMTTPDAVELLLMSVAAALLAGSEQAAGQLQLKLPAVDVYVHAALRTHGACHLTVDYDITFVSNEPETRLAQLHEELRQTSTVLQLVSAGTLLNGRMHTRRS